MTESDVTSRRRESRQVFGTLAFLGLVALTVAAATRHSQDSRPPDHGSWLPAISGMAFWKNDPASKQDFYVVVHDAKHPGQDRAGVLRVIPGTSPHYQALPMREDGQPGPLVDLESIAAVPGRPGEFLLLESGASYGAKQPRRALVQVEVPDDLSELRVLGYVDVAPLTPSLVDCESLLCWRHGDQMRVLIADRGETTGPALRAQTFTGIISLASNGAALSVAPLPPSESGPAETVQVEVPSSEKWRTCSDLFIDSQSRVWAACAHDPGDDGPFRARVYLAGTLADGRIRFTPGVIEYSLDGLKVEALGPCSIPGSPLCVATDDEDYGGVWRPLPPKP